MADPRSLSLRLGGKEYPCFKRLIFFTRGGKKAATLLLIIETIPWYTSTHLLYHAFPFPFFFFYSLKCGRGTRRGHEYDSWLLRKRSGKATDGDRLAARRGEKGSARWGRRKSPFGNSLFPTSIDFFPRELQLVGPRLLLEMKSNLQAVHKPMQGGRQCVPSPIKITRSKLPLESTSAMMPTISEWQDYNCAIVPRMLAKIIPLQSLKAF